MEEDWPWNWLFSRTDALSQQTKRANARLGLSPAISRLRTSNSMNSPNPFEGDQFSESSELIHSPKPFSLFRGW